MADMLLEGLVLMAAFSLAFLGIFLPMTWYERWKKQQKTKKLVKNMEAIKCPVCDGRGEVFRLSKEAMALKVLGEPVERTMYGWEPCNVCEARGYIILK